MAISTNAKEIEKYFYGSDKVYEQSGVLFYPIEYVGDVLPPGGRNATGIMVDPTNPTKGELTGSLIITKPFPLNVVVAKVKTSKTVNVADVYLEIRSGSRLHTGYIKNNELIFTTGGTATSSLDIATFLVVTNNNLATIS
ncbi:MAG: hypothetical protein LKJ43_02895 [Lentilactobacillus buchneri]|jgi:hypothetical protein|nr:hypothetical protein [Lentilactobacillus buchneri]MCI1950659.1 hypothetical protein [Lentilactobacillus buchneri]MCI2018264.1 hypothetical protein [Lentilactobacillus buchneri]MCI2027785.1 hypothetical protein [Lentilactobacillus buchneri]